MDDGTKHWKSCLRDSFESDKKYVLSLQVTDPSRSCMACGQSFVPMEYRAYGFRSLHNVHISTNLAILKRKCLRCGYGWDEQPLNMPKPEYNFRVQRVY